MSIPKSILVIDDEYQIRRLLKIGLEDAGYSIHEAIDGKTGIQETINQRPSLVILDLGLPDEDGLIILKKLREFSDIPIIILSVRNSEKDIIAALDSGANDYMTKPFHVGELLARIRALLRISQPEQSSPIFKNGSISIDFSSRTVKNKNKIIKLTATEFSLLALFIRNAGKVLTHQYILKEIWGKPYSEDTQYLRVYISSLRKKFEDDPSLPKKFITDSGVGYRLVLEE